MSTQLFLPHDDFKSSRKALIISTVFTLIFTKMELAAEKAKIFNLEIIINQDQIIFWSVIFSFYLLSMFLFNAMQETKIYSLKQQDFLSNLQEEIIQNMFASITNPEYLSSLATQDILKDAIERRLDSLFDQRKFSNAIEFKFIIMLVGAPTIFSLYAIISAVSRLLS